MKGCYTTSPMLEKKLEGVGYGAGNKIALNRSETVLEARGVGGQAGRCRRSSAGARCAWVKRFPRSQCRVATGWKQALPYHASGALGCSPAPNNKLPRDLISSWLR